MGRVVSASAKPLLQTSTPAIIDCDVHHYLSSTEKLLEYLPPRWQTYHRRIGLRRQSEPGYYVTRPRRSNSRVDAMPSSGLPAGSDLDFLREQLLDRWNIRIAILNSGNVAQLSIQPGDYGAALTRAINDWTLTEWLDAEPRLVSAIVVPFNDPDQAEDEIRRLSHHPRFVQVLITLRNADLLGNRRFWRVYKAAAEAGLPIGVHVGGIAGQPLTGAGWPSYYFEVHAGHPQAFAAQLSSLVFSGVFDEIPRLQFVLIEGGFAWVPSLCWRMDRAWRILGEEVPDLKQEPSWYVRHHFSLTTQPIEEPERPEQFREILDALDMNGRLLFSTDYPHWDFDAPDRALPRDIPSGLRRQIMSSNAISLYRFEGWDGA